MTLRYSRLEQPTVNRNTLTEDDQRYLDAALGWLGLRRPSDALLELASVTAQFAFEILCARHIALEQEGRWGEAGVCARRLCEVAPAHPFGWNQVAYCLHRSGRTREASELLLSIAHRFPQEELISYNVACFLAMLGHKERALDWLKRTIAIVGPDRVREIATKDPESTSMLELFTEAMAGSRISPLVPK